MGLDEFAEFQIHGVRLLTIDSIPVGFGKEIDISSLKTQESRELLESLILKYFNKNPKKDLLNRELLDITEQKLLYAVVGDKITEEKLKNIEKFVSEGGLDKKYGRLTILQLLEALRSGNKALSENAVKILSRIARQDKSVASILIGALEDKK